jgi:hypothetical protein
MNIYDYAVPAFLFCGGVWMIFDGIKTVRTQSQSSLFGRLIGAKKDQLSNESSILHGSIDVALGVAGVLLALFYMVF